MRIAAALLGLAVLGATSAAQARDYPVCLRIYQSYHDWYDECAYATLAQCQMSASGRAAQCLDNPWYKPEPVKKQRRHRG